MYFDAPYDRKKQFPEQHTVYKITGNGKLSTTNSYRMPLRPVMIATDVKLG